MRTLFVVVAMFCVSVSGFAQSVSMSEFKNRQVTFVGQNFKKYDTDRKFQVQFSINNTPLDQIVAESNGSFSYTTPSGRVKTGDDVKVQVNQWYSETSHWVKTFDIPVSEERKEEVRRFKEKIPAYAEQQANTLANRVAEDLGAIVKWKRSFGSGFVDYYEDYSNRNREGRNSYSQGEDVGETQGSNAGYRAGTSSAQSRAESYASDRVTSAFENAVDDPKRTSIKTLDSRAPEAQFTGDRSPETKSSLEPVSSRINREVTRKAHVSTRYLSNDLGSIMIEHANRYASSSADWENTLSAYEAYQAWIHGRLGGNYDYNLWNHELMTDDLKQEFAEEFKRTYRRNIEDKIDRESSGTDYSALSLGRSAGREFGEAQVHEDGRVSGYNSKYGLAADRGFEEHFEKQFNETFSSTLQYYNTHSILSRLKAELLEENDNYLWERGEKLGLKISSLVNTGGLDATVQVSTLSDSGSQSLKSFRFTLPALSSLKSKSQVFKEVAQILNTVSDEQEYSVTVKVGTQSTTLNYYIGWRNVITDLGIRLIDANRNCLWEKGEEIGVVITSGKNKSRVNAHLPVRLIGSGLDAIPSSKSFSLNAQSQVSTAMEFLPLARIRKDVTENERQSLVLSLGTLSFPFSYAVGWLNLVETYGVDPRVEFKVNIHKAIIAEWEAVIASGQYDNWYKYGRSGKKTLLEDLVRIAQTKGEDKYLSLASKEICEMVSGYYWMRNPWNYNFASSFKKLYRTIDRSCK
ncbi:MAG: hypothetical protein KA715_05700 [Xanthomonadaceae bacterium]|nr:hypothetical protein [Xanthomonadaceae bacterium]